MKESKKGSHKGYGGKAVKGAHKQEGKLHGTSGKKIAASRAHKVADEMMEAGGHTYGKKKPGNKYAKGKKC